MKVPDTVSQCFWLGISSLTGFSPALNILILCSLFLGEYTTK